MANKRIQGITIELDGNTQPLENALKSLNKEIKTVEGDLKNVDKALKLNPGDTEQVARKLELLAEKAELSEKKVEALKAAQQKMEADGVDKSSKAYKDLQTELSKAEGELRALTTEMERTERSSKEVVDGQKQLSTYLEATGQTADDLVSIIGSKLVDAYKSGQLGAAGYERALQDIAKASTGSKDNVEALRKVLSSVDSGNSIESIADQITLLGTKSAGAKRDVTSLTKDFVGLTNEVSGLDSDLKKINQALEFDTTSVDKLTDKQSVLTQAVQASEKQLELLKAEYRTVTPGDVGEDKFKALEAEIGRTEKRLSEYKAELSNTNQALVGMDASLSGLGTKLKSVNESLHFDSSSIDSLKAKEDLLTQAVSQTEQKVAALSVEIKTVDPTTDLGKEKFAALSNELEQAETCLSGYKTELSSVSTEIDSFGQNQQRLQTFFDATKTSLSQFSNVLGSELVSALNSGTANAKQLETAVDKIGQECTGSRTNIDQFRSALDQIDDGVSLDRIKQDIDAIGNEANAAKQPVDELKQGFSDLGSKLDLSNALEGFDAVSDVLEGIGEKVQELGVASLDSAGRVQDSQAQIQMGLGVTAEEADKLKDHAENIFSQGYAESIDDATAKMVEVKQVLGDINDADLEHVTTGFSTLETMGLDYNESLRAVDNMMKSFGITSSQAMDLLVTGTQNGLNKSDELADNIAEYAPRWGEAGVSASQYFSMLEAGSEASSYNLDKVGDFLNEFLTSLSDGRLEENMGMFSSKTQEVFEQYKSGGANAQDVLNAVIADMGNMSTETEKASAASTLWSSLGEDNALGMIEALGGVQDKYGDIAGASDAAIESNTNSVTTMQNTWQMLKDEALAPVGEALANVATVILEKIGPAIQGFSDWFTNLDPTIQTTIIVIGALVAAITVIAPIIMGVVAAFAAMSGAITAAGGVMAVLSGAVLPFIGIAAAVVAAIAGIVAVIMNWDTICQAVSGAWDTFCKGVSEAFTQMGEGIRQDWDQITQWFSGIGQQISDKWNEICTTVSDKWNSFTKGIGDAWNTCKDTVGKKVDEFKENTQKAFENIKNKGTEIWNSLRSNVEEKVNTLRENVGKTVDNVRSKASEIFTNTKEDATRIWGDLTSNVSQKAENLKGNVQETCKQVGEKMLQSWDDLKRNTGKTWDNIKSTIKGAIDKLKGFFNFHWELPKIKLPHFRIQGKFSLNPPQIPTFGVDWYAKGGILTTPTIFGASGSSLLGGGEAGHEAVLPIDNLREYIRDEINGSALVDRLDRMIKLLEQTSNSKVVLDSGQLVGALVKPMDQALGQERILSGRR